MESAFQRHLRLVLACEDYWGQGIRAIAANPLETRGSRVSGNATPNAPVQLRPQGPGRNKVANDTSRIALGGRRDSPDKSHISSNCDKYMKDILISLILTSRTAV